MTFDLTGSFDLNNYEVKGRGTRETGFWTQKITQKPTGWSGDVLIENDRGVDLIPYTCMCL